VQRGERVAWSHLRNRRATTRIRKRDESVQIEAFCGCNARADRREGRTGCDASRSCSSVTILGAHGDSERPSANKTESLSPLLRDDTPLSTANEIGIKEAAASDESWVGNRRSSHTREGCSVGGRDERVVWIRPPTRPFGNHRERHRRSRDCAPIHPPWRYVKVCSEKRTDDLANAHLHWVFVIVISTSLNAQCFCEQKE
jgi:hypothetical protein